MYNEKTALLYERHSSSTLFRSLESSSMHCIVPMEADLRYSIPGGFTEATHVHRSSNWLSPVVNCSLVFDVLSDRKPIGSGSHSEPPY